MLIFPHTSDYKKANLMLRLGRGGGFCWRCNFFYNLLWASTYASRRRLNNERLKLESIAHLLQLMNFSECDYLSVCVITKLLFRRLRGWCGASTRDDVTRWIDSRSLQFAGPRAAAQTGGYGRAIGVRQLKRLVTRRRFGVQDHIPLNCWLVVSHLEL